MDPLAVAILLASILLPGLVRLLVRRVSLSVRCDGCGKAEGIRFVLGWKRSGMRTYRQPRRVAAAPDATAEHDIPACAGSNEKP